MSNSASPPAEPEVYPVNYILFRVAGAQLKFFRAKTRPEIAVGALFRFIRVVVFRFLNLFAVLYVLPVTSARDAVRATITIISQ